MPNENGTPVAKRDTPRSPAAIAAAKLSPKPKTNAVSNRTIVDIFRAESVPATEFRRICDGIGWTADLPEKPAGPKKILITSSVTDEGKSTVAAFVALTAAIYLDQRTLLLDCDMRRPTVHRMFGEPLSGGLSECLKDAGSFDSCVRTTAVDKLKVMTAGSTTGDPSDLLNAERWPDLLAEASFYFDRIVIDCAPIIPVDDAITIGRNVDGVLMVIRAGSTQREVAIRAAQMIRNSKLNLLGVVLNNLDEALPYYYSQKYYGYRYKNTR
jgi:capsular exopolysaccharide synthesis family protein